MLKILFSVFFTCISAISARAYVVNYDISEPGTLIKQLNVSQIKEITEAHVRGNLNGTDILAINKMVNLEFLDMSEAHIVRGGQSYHDKYYTEDNVFGSYFFNNLANLRVLYMPNVEIVRGDALHDNNNLKELRVSPSIKEVEERAYPNSIEIIDIPNLKNWCEASHYSSAFANQTELKVNGQTIKTLNIPEGTTKISSRAFCWCETFTEINIPNSVTHIEEWAFYRSLNQSRQITKIKFGNSIKNIDNNAFGKCPQVRALNFPASLTNINHNSIVAENLDTLIIEDGADSIKIDYSFMQNINGLHYFYMGRNMSFTNNGQPDYCTVHIFQEEGEIKIGDFVSKISADLFAEVAPKKIQMGKYVNVIEDGAFENSNIGDSINLSQITHIGKYAFNNSSVKKIILGKNLKSIGEYALTTGDTIQIEVPSIDCWLSVFRNTDVYNTHYASPFYISVNGKLLESLIIDKKDEIPAFAFKGCCSLKNIKFKCKVKRIWREAFAESNIETLKFEKPVWKIGSGAFANCKQLKEIIISDSIYSIGGSFYGCNSLSNIELGKCKIIGSGSFDADCANLLNLELPSTLDSIGGSAFPMSINLHNLRIEDSPNKLEIDNRNFSDPWYREFNHSVKNLYIGRDLDLDYFQGFMYELGFDSLQTLTFGYLVNELDRYKNGDGSYKLRGRASFCVSDSVICEGIEPPQIDEYTFIDTYENAVLVVPKGCRNTYWLHPYWGKFTSIEEKEFQVKNIEIDSLAQNIPLNGEVSFHAKMTPNYPEKIIIWGSSNPKIASVSDTGVVRGVSEGIADITVSCDNCIYTFTVYVGKTTDINKKSGDIPNNVRNNVYTIDGKVVHKNSIEELTSGMYIINGNKILIRK